MNPALLCGGVTLVATLAASAASGAFVYGIVAGVVGGVAACAVVFLVLREPDQVAGTDTRLEDSLAANSQLRHDLRGALSPALLVSDRLVGHTDPAVAKAGGIVVRAVERATGLLEVNKQEDVLRAAVPGS